MASPAQNSWPKYGTSTPLTVIVRAGSGSEWSWGNGGVAVIGASSTSWSWKNARHAQRCWSRASRGDAARRGGGPSTAAGSWA